GDIFHCVADAPIFAEVEAAVAEELYQAIGSWVGGAVGVFVVEGDGELLIRNASELLQCLLVNIVHCPEKLDLELDELRPLLRARVVARHSHNNSYIGADGEFGELDLIEGGVEDGGDICWHGLDPSGFELGWVDLDCVRDTSPDECGFSFWLVFTEVL